MFASTWDRDGRELLRHASRCNDSVNEGNCRFRRARAMAAAAKLRQITSSYLVAAFVIRTIHGNPCSTLFLPSRAAHHRSLPQYYMIRCNRLVQMAIQEQGK